MPNHLKIKTIDTIINNYSDRDTLSPSLSECKITKKSAFYRQHSLRNRILLKPHIEEVDSQETVEEQISGANDKL